MHSHGTAVHRRQQLSNQLTLANKVSGHVRLGWKSVATACSTPYFELWESCHVVLGTLGKRSVFVPGCCLKTQPALQKTFQRDQSLLPLGVHWNLNGATCVAGAVATEEKRMNRKEVQ